MNFVLRRTHLLFLPKKENEISWKHSYIRLMLRVMVLNEPMLLGIRLNELQCFLLSLFQHNFSLANSRRGDTVCKQVMDGENNTGRK